MASHPKYNLNPDGSYMDENQILADLPNRIQDESTLAAIRSNFEPPPDATGDEAIGYHFSKFQFGMWIRNSYGLWCEDNPYTVVNPPPNKDGILDHPFHPDNLSGRIVDRFVAQLNSPTTEIGA